MPEGKHQSVTSYRLNSRELVQILERCCHPRYVIPVRKRINSCLLLLKVIINKLYSLHKLLDHVTEIKVS